MSKDMVRRSRIMLGTHQPLRNLDANRAECPLGRRIRQATSPNPLATYRDRWTWGARRKKTIMHVAMTLAMVQTT